MSGWERGSASETAKTGGANMAWPDTGRGGAGQTDVLAAPVDHTLRDQPAGNSRLYIAVGAQPSPLGTKAQNRPSSGALPHFA